MGTMFFDTTNIFKLCRQHRSFFIIFLFSLRAIQHPSRKEKHSVFYDTNRAKYLFLCSLK
jgi:hypothetical protein